MQNHSEIVRLLMRADQAFVEHNYAEGEKLQEEALDKVFELGSNDFIELLAIHFCRCAYLNWSANTTDTTTIVRKQFNKGFEYINKLRPQDISSKNKLFFAQSFYAMWILDFSKLNSIKDSIQNAVDDDVLRRILSGDYALLGTIGRSVLQNLISVDAIQKIASRAKEFLRRAKEIMRTIPIEERTEEEHLYIKSYSLNNELIPNIASFLISLSSYFFREEKGSALPQNEEASLPEDDEESAIAEKEWNYIFSREIVDFRNRHPNIEAYKTSLSCDCDNIIEFADEAYKAATLFALKGVKLYFHKKKRNMSHNQCLLKIKNQK